ncbi:hypothetical protein Tco_0533241 [Tanacetum coccineum]
MHTRASNSELVEPLPEPERTLNRRLHRRNMRVPFEQRIEPPAQPKVVYAPILDINYFCHFFDILENYNPMDDEPMWAADRVVAPTLGFAITIPETANEFSIKGNHLTLVKGNQSNGRIKTNPHKCIHEFLGICDMFKYRDTENEVVRLMMFPYHSRKTVAFTDDGSSNSDTDKIMARMDAMTMKMDAQYKEFQSLPKQPNIDHNDDDKPILADKQSARPYGYLPSNTQPNSKGSSSKPYQPPQAQNEHVNAAFTRSSKSCDPHTNPNDQQNDSETPINFNSEDEDKEPTPQPESQTPKPIKETLIPKPYKRKIPYPQCLRKEKNGSPICKAYSCNALADLGASINLMPYSLYAKLSLETLKPTKMNFVILEMEEDNKVPLFLGRPLLFIADAVIRVKQKQLNLGVGTERMTFHTNSAMKHSHSNNDTCFSIDVIDEILEEDFDALLDEGSKILHSIEGTILKEKLFVEFDEFMVMTIDENSESESDTEEPPFENITFNTDYKIKTPLEEPPFDLELKPLPDNLEYVFLEEPSFLPVIISSQLFGHNKNNLIFVLKRHKQALLGRHQTFMEYVSLRCMLAIFHDMIEESVEVFIDDFLVFGNSFDNCLKNLDKMLQRCKDANLVLNWEKCHFMVKEGIVLGHKVSGAGFEVDKAKIDVISKLPPPTNVKGIRSFLGHASFYRHFIKDFSKITCPLTKFLEKDTPFEFNDESY